MNISNPMAMFSGMSGMTGASAAAAQSDQSGLLSKALKKLFKKKSDSGAPIYSPSDSTPASVPSPTQTAPASSGVPGGFSEGTGGFNLGLSGGDTGPPTFSPDASPDTPKTTIEEGLSAKKKKDWHGFGKKLSAAGAGLAQGMDVTQGMGEPIRPPGLLF